MPRWFSSCCKGHFNSRQEAMRRLVLECLEDRTVLHGNLLSTAAVLPFTSFGTAHRADFLATPNSVTLYKVQLNAGDRIDASVTAQATGSGLQSVLRLFNSHGVPLALCDQEGGDPRLTFQASTRGAYYLGVSSAGDDAYDPTTARSGKGGTTHGLYSLDMRWTAGTPLLTDLAGASFRLTTGTTAVAGDRVVGTFTVDNRGGANAGPFHVQVLLSSSNRFDPASSTVLTTVAIASLAAGHEQHETFSAVLPSDVPPGSMFVGLRIDPAQTIPELNPLDQAGVHRGADWEPLTLLTPVTASGGNHTRTRADAIADLNSRVGGVLTANQADWYLFTLTTNGQLTASVTAPGVPVRLSLYDQTGALLIQSVGQSPTQPDPLIVQHLTGVAAGTPYFLEVEGRGGSGSYALTTQFKTAVPPSNYLHPDGQPSSIVTGDFTGSGILDLAVAGDTVNVFLGLGDGTFQPAQTIDDGHTPLTLVVGDVSGDGIPDLIVLNTDDTLSVLLGQGDGTFQVKPEDYDAGDGALDVLVGDFGTKGQLDIAVADGNSNQVAVLLGNGDGTFQDPTFYPVGDKPSALVAGDFTGRGTLDLATANASSDDVSVLLGNGDGTFGSEIRTDTVGTTPEAVVAGDFTGNGVLDLATANLNSNDVTILTGNGDGTFQVGSSISVGNSPLALRAADLNGNGRLDLAVTNRDDSSVTVLQGQGDGTFTSVETTGTALRPTDLRVGDFNGDGLPDLAVMCQTNNKVDILLGQGAGLFPSYTSPATVPENQTFTPVTGDFTGNGIPDLAIANYDFGTISLLLGNGDGTFHNGGQFACGEQPTALVAGVFTEDGNEDLVTNGGSDAVTFLLGRGDGTFAAPLTTSLSFTPAYLVSGHFTEDGRLDLAAISGAGQVAVLANNGDGTFRELPPLTVSSGDFFHLAAGDFTGDGLTDLAVACSSLNNVTILINQGQGRFVLDGSYPVGQNPSALITGDFRNKGILDLATSNLDDNTVSVLLGNGDGTFGQQVDYSVDDGPHSLAAAPITTAGTLDLVTVNFFGDSVSVLPGNGDGTFQQNTDYSTLSGSRPMTLVTGDFNGDHLADVATFNQGYTNVSILLNQGDGTLSSPQPFSLGLRVKTMISGDWNNDGATDKVLSSILNGSIQVDLNNGDGFFSTNLVTVSGQDPIALVGGDFNGDGREDLAVADSGAQEVTILLGDGNGHFQFDETLQVAGVPTALAVGDFTGDGNLDLAVALSGPGQVLVFLGTGDGQFRPAGRYAVGLAPVSLIVGAFHRPGVLDLAVADSGSSDVVVLQGRGDGTFFPAQFYPVGAAPQELGAADLTGTGQLDLVTADEDSNDVTVLLGQPDGSFLSAGRVPAGSTPTAVAIADFNSDGQPDLAVLDKLSSQVTLLFGQGDGTFLPGGILDVHADATMISADFNGDAQPDLALLDQNSSSSWAQFGVGNGTFYGQGQILAPVLATPLAGKVTGVPDVTVLGLNGRILVRAVDPRQPGLLDPPQVVNPAIDPADPNSGFPARDVALISIAGQPEIVALDAHDNGFSFYTFDSSSGQFRRTAGPQVPGDLPVSLTVGDVNKDGRDDLLVAALGSDQVFVYPQSAAGTFGPDPTYRLATGIAPNAITLADLNGDGLPDVVVTNQFSGDVSVFLNSPSAPFAEEQRFRAGLGPFQLGTLISDGTGSTVYSENDTPVAAVAGHFRGNSTSDLVVLDRRSAALVLLPGDGHGGLDNPQAPLSLAIAGAGFNQPQALVAAPFDSSGRLDLAVLDAYNDQVLLLAGDGSGHFTPLSAVNAGHSPTGIAAIDLNGDGKLDLLVGDVFGDVLVLEGNGNGTFRAPPPLTGNRAPLAVQPRQGNQGPEVLVANQARNRVTVQTLAASAEQFVPVQTLRANPTMQLAPGAVQWASLEGPTSPSPDAIVLASGSNSVLVYRGTGFDPFGRPTFAAPRTFSVGTDPVGVTVTDVNGDGILDLLVSNMGSNDISILFGARDGNGHWTATAGPRLKSGGVGPVATTLRDLDGSGFADLVVTNSNGTIAVLPGRGQGFFDDRNPQLLNIPDGTALGPPSFPGGSDVGLAVNGNGDVIAVNLDTFTSAVVFQASAGQEVNALEALTDEEAVVAFRDGSVATLVAEASGPFALTQTFLPLTGELTDPSALQVFDSGAGLQVLVTNAGQDQVFLFAPLSPSGPLTEVNPSPSASLSLIVTILIGGRAPGTPLTANPPAGAPGSLLASGPGAETLPPANASGGESEELGDPELDNEAGNQPGGGEGPPPPSVDFGIDIDEKLRRIDLGPRLPIPSPDNSSWHRETPAAPNSPLAAIPELGASDKLFKLWTIELPTLPILAPETSRGLQPVGQAFQPDAGRSPWEDDVAVAMEPRSQPSSTGYSVPSTASLARQNIPEWTFLRPDRQDIRQEGLPDEGWNPQSLPPILTSSSPSGICWSYFLFLALNSAMYFSGFSRKASAQPEQQT